MKITLRKANAIQASIQEAIRNVKVETNVELNEFQNVESEIQNARAKLLEGDKRREALLKALYGIRGAVGTANATATISDIRFAGFAVYANQHKDTKGRVTTKYRLGKPSRAIVAAGYKAMALGLV